MTKELREMGYDEIIEFSAQVLKEVRRRAYAEGYEQGAFDAEMEYRYEPTDDITYWGPQEQRDRIVEQAKDDVEDLEESEALSCRRIDYVVNKEKRTVVALVKYVYNGDKLRSRGIAKCAPDDCFNVHLGRAIALRRALGLEVPAEYLNAPQPTEVHVGDVVEEGGKQRRVISDGLSVVPGTCHITSYRAEYGVVIDDSREEVSE